eukprot:TRINITY_DN1759_c0_g1_i1.p1 TRINITY_DN1759_c0_g1~~TRINITY_DN1759_c0_g1_i1.p1  ORF type:complete len:718 (+),score=212.13 TRINITY_DN1759_c0_g1_i1:129-2282(+)
MRAVRRSSRVLGRSYRNRSVSRNSNTFSSSSITSSYRFPTESTTSHEYSFNSSLISLKSSSNLVLKRFYAAGNPANPNPPSTEPPKPTNSYASLTNDPTKIRNIAIIAHVDHGKTSMVDMLLVHSGTLATHEKSARGDRVMDSNALEQERGITIVAKQTAVEYNGHLINIVDTPGHGDFGGEVERILTMIDGVVLLVDASEGVMPQTKFVLGKALARGLKVIVCLNKMDKPHIRADDVETEIFDLFTALNATNEQLDYVTLYSSARDGWAVRDLANDQKDSVAPILDVILEQVSPPKEIGAPTDPFKMLVTSLGNDSHMGKVLSGKIQSGVIRKGDTVKILSVDGRVVQREGKVLKIIGTRGLGEVLLDEARGGNIVGLCGLPTGTVTNTVCTTTVNEPLKAIPIDPPVISMLFGINDSPLAGKEGKKATSEMLFKRLKYELDQNVTLQMVETGRDGLYEIRGRGGLQLSILAENLRREGFELSVYPPKVLMKDGGKLEPIEEVTIDVDKGLAGSVVERLSLRLGKIEGVKWAGGDGDKGAVSRIVCTIPARTLIGFRSELNEISKGEAQMNQSFKEYAKHKGEMNAAVVRGGKGALISSTGGKVTNYALQGLDGKGTLFIEAGDEVYEGMVIGECTKSGDLTVNPCKLKHVTNVRSVVKEDFYRLQPKKVMPLEEMITYIAEDEVLEVTPKSLRIRKLVMKEQDRLRIQKNKKKDK